MLASVGFAFGAAPSAMRPTSPRPVVSGVVPQAAACVGSLLAARADAQVAPASALIQTSPTLPPRGGGTAPRVVGADAERRAGWGRGLAGARIRAADHEAGRPHPDDVP